MLHTISSVINSVNPFQQFYTQAANQIEQAGDQDKSIKMVLRAGTCKDSLRYKLPNVPEVALILPDTPQNLLPRDIILYRKTEDYHQQKSVVKIFETHPHFDPLQHTSDALTKFESISRTPEWHMPSDYNFRKKNNSSQNNRKCTCWTHCIHSTHCINNNKRLSSPTVSNKTVLCHDYKQFTGSNIDKSWN